MTHEFDTCGCVLCLSFRRVYGLLYAREATGALQRKGIELLRVVHSQLLDYSEGGEGAATPGPPDLPVEGDKDKKKVVKEESEPEVEKADAKKGEAPVVVPEEGQASSPGGGGEPEPAKEEGLKEEKKKTLRPV